MADAKRVFVVILDSFGIGCEPDAAEFGDEGTNTLGSVRTSAHFHCTNMEKLGLFAIDGVEPMDSLDGDQGNAKATGAYARMQERSLGKDTIIGHWELAGLVSPKPMPTFPNGFPKEFIDAFSEAVGRPCICNLPYSGTEVIKKYGEEHLKTGALIVYTSADSVFQIAANESLVPVEELYRDCEIARKMLTGDLAVGRVIARPFVGTCAADFTRTVRRHDYALAPFAPTMLNAIQEQGMDVLGVGKINDIFNGSGITWTTRTTGNADGMEKSLDIVKNRDFNGLCFINLVDFDMLYGHRRDIDGYAQALSDWDVVLGNLLKEMRPDDLLMISADHGCDPSYTKTTDHTREYVPLLMTGAGVTPGMNYHTTDGFTFLAQKVCDALGVKASFYPIG